MCPPSCTLQKRPSPPLHFDQEEIYARPLQKGLLSPFSLARNRIYLGSNVTEELTDICFESYRGYPYSHISRVGRGW